MRIASFEVTEELGAALEKSAKSRLVSVEDEIRAILSDYFAYKQKQVSRQFALGSMLKTAGLVLTQVASTFEQKKVD